MGMRAEKKEEGIPKKNLMKMGDFRNRDLGDSFLDHKKELQSMILSRLDLSREVPDEEIKDIIDELIIAQSKKLFLSLNDRGKLRQELFYSIRKLDILQALVDDAEVTEIMVNGTDEIFIERNGQITGSGMRFESKEKLEDVIQRIAAGCNRTVNEASPIVDARLENGSRVNVVLSPVALNGPILTIRRFPDMPMGMELLKELGSITEEADLFLKKLVRAKYNIFISGARGNSIPIKIMVSNLLNISFELFA